MVTFTLNSAVFAAVMAVRALYVPFITTPVQLAPAPPKVYTAVVPVAAPTGMLKVQLPDAFATVMVAAPEVVGVPEPTSVTGCEPRTVNVPEVVKVIPLAELAASEYAPRAVAFTLTVNVLLLVNATPWV